MSRPASALPIFASVYCLPIGETTRAPFLRQRDASGISAVTHISNFNAFGNPVVRCICAFPDENHAHVRSSRRPNWSRAVGDHENVEPKTRRHAVDLLTYRTRVTTNVDVRQFLVRFLSTRDLLHQTPPVLVYHRLSATPLASTSASVLLPP